MVLGLSLGGLARPLDVVLSVTWATAYVTWVTACPMIAHGFEPRECTFKHVLAGRHALGSPPVKDLDDTRSSVTPKLCRHRPLTTTNMCLV